MPYRNAEYQYSRHPYRSTLIYFRAVRRVNAKRVMFLRAPLSTFVPNSINNQQFNYLQRPRGKRVLQLSLEDVI